jgi:hypothetical protein
MGNVSVKDAAKFMAENWCVIVVLLCAMAVVMFCFMTLVNKAYALNSRHHILIDPTNGQCYFNSNGAARPCSVSAVVK